MIDLASWQQFVIWLCLLALAIAYWVERGKSLRRKEAIRMLLTYHPISEALS